MKEADMLTRNLKLKLWITILENII